MAFHCAKCERYGRRWDAEARALTCCYNPCRTIIRIADHRGLPRPEKLSTAGGQPSRTLLNTLPDNPMCPY